MEQGSTVYFTAIISEILCSEVLTKLSDYVTYSLIEIQINLISSQNLKAKMKNVSL